VLAVAVRRLSRNRTHLLNYGKSRNSTAGVPHVIEAVSMPLPLLVLLLLLTSGRETMIAFKATPRS